MAGVATGSPHYDHHPPAQMPRRDKARLPVVFPSVLEIDRGAVKNFASVDKVNAPARPESWRV